jgi:hypothetical protein
MHSVLSHLVDSWMGILADFTRVHCESCSKCFCQCFFTRLNLKMRWDEMRWVLKWSWQDLNEITCHNTRWSTPYNTYYGTYDMLRWSSPSQIWCNQTFFMNFPYLLQPDYILQLHTTLQKIYKYFIFGTSSEIYCHRRTWSPNDL